jgi:hypothetical protein
MLRIRQEGLCMALLALLRGLQLVSNTFSTSCGPNSVSLLALLALLVYLQDTVLGETWRTRS